MDLREYAAFTGTQRGMTGAQADSVGRLLEETLSRWQRPALRIGDCTGADEQFYAMARAVGGYYLVGHPPINPAKRAFCDYDLELEPEEYLVRNRRMVDGSGVLWATPGEEHDVLRSGTWSTVRYAGRLGVPVQLVLPDGEVITR